MKGGNIFKAIIEAITRFFASFRKKKYDEPMEIEVVTPVRPSIKTISTIKELPWLAAMKEAHGKHEVHDNAWLKKWLVSDGKTLGDPAKLPWCGDGMETAVRLGLPKEHWHPTLEKNPYWARNWLHFGNECLETYGAIVIYSRGKGGHVGILVGTDDEFDYVYGCNQLDSVNVAAIDKKRRLGIRWPNSHPIILKPLPRYKKGSVPQSVNEI